MNDNNKPISNMGANTNTYYDDDHGICSIPDLLNYFGGDPDEWFVSNKSAQNSLGVCSRESKNPLINPAAVIVSSDSGPSTLIEPAVTSYCDYLSDELYKYLTNAIGDYPWDLYDKLPSNDEDMKEDAVDLDRRSNPLVRSEARNLPINHGSASLNDSPLFFFDERLPSRSRPGYALTNKRKISDIDPSVESSLEIRDKNNRRTMFKSTFFQSNSIQSPPVQSSSYDNNMDGEVTLPTKL